MTKEMGASHHIDVLTSAFGFMASRQSKTRSVISSFGTLYEYLRHYKVYNK